MRVLLLVLLALTFVPAALRAHLDEYGPFTSVTAPKRFRVRELVQGTAPFDGSVLDLYDSNRQSRSRNPMLRVSWTKDDLGIDIAVLAYDKTTIAAPIHVSSQLIIPWGYCADINGDGALDFILMISYGSNGAIGGGLRDTVFVLSSENTYKISMIQTLYSDADDFLDLSGQFHFLYSSVRGEIPGRDGRSHNYWLYNLLAVDGSTLKLADSALPGFPKWILWTFRPNHSETSQLTTEQKRRLVESGNNCIVSSPDNPCPDYFRLGRR
jgi:hypothetical protein